MQLTITGAIRLGTPYLTSDGQKQPGAYLARRTNDEQWLITNGQRVVGYAADLTEAETMVAADESHRTERLAQLETKAQQR